MLEVWILLEEIQYTQSMISATWQKIGTRFGDTYI